MGRLSSRFSLARDSWDRHSTGTCSSLAMIFSIRLMSDTACWRFLAAIAFAAGGGHQLQVVDDHQAQVVDAAGTWRSCPPPSAGGCRRCGCPAG